MHRPFRVKSWMLIRMTIRYQYCAPNARGGAPIRNASRILRNLQNHAISDIGRLRTHSLLRHKPFSSVSLHADSSRTTQKCLQRSRADGTIAAGGIVQTEQPLFRIIRYDCRIQVVGAASAIVSMCMAKAESWRRKIEKKYIAAIVRRKRYRFMRRQDRASETDKGHAAWSVPRDR